jgi:hypothetical protein
MTTADGARLVTASELVEALASAAGSKIEIARNGGGRVSGVFLRADLASAEVDGRPYPVVHLLMQRVTRDGTTPVIVSLLTGAAPDEDFFWPVCPIDVRGELFQLR